MNQSLPPRQPRLTRRRPPRTLAVRLARLAAVLVALAVPSAPARCQAAASVPPDPVARAQRFLAEADARSALGALEEADAVLKSDRSRLVPALRLKGYVLVQLRRDAEAEAVFRHVLALDPEDGYARFELAKRLHARNAFAEARRHYEALAGLDPYRADVQEHLARLAAAERDHAEVAAQIHSGEQVIAWLGFLTVLLLVGFGLLLRFLLLRAAAPSRV